MPSDRPLIVFFYLCFVKRYLFLHHKPLLHYCLWGGFLCFVVSGCSPHLAAVGTGGLLSRSFDNYSQSTIVRSETQMTAERPLVASSTPVPKNESTRATSATKTERVRASRWQVIEPEGYTASQSESSRQMAAAVTPRESAYTGNASGKSATTRASRIPPRSTGIPKATESSVASLENVTFVTQETAAPSTTTSLSSGPAYSSSSYSETAPTAAEAPLSRREQRALDKQRREEAKRLLAARESETTAAEYNAVPVRAPQPQRPASIAVPSATVPTPNLSATVAQAVTMPSANVTSTTQPTFTQSEKTVTLADAGTAAVAPPAHNFKPNETEHVKFSYYDPFGEGNNRFLVVLGEQRFCYPYPGKFLSGYGPRGRSIHTGVDIKGVKNDTIRAAFAGTVRMSKPYSGYGNCVVIRHKNGLETLYAHNSRNLVRVGDVVRAGDPIALIGRTGRATTEHCHFEVRIQGQHINPALILDVNNHTLREGVLSVTKQSNGRIVAVNRASGLAPSQATDVEDSSPSTVAAGGGETRMASSTSSKSSSSRNSGATTYTVKSGDSLWSIARKFGTTISALCTLNNLDREATLPLGKRLRIR